MAQAKYGSLGSHFMKQIILFILIMLSQVSLALAVNEQPFVNSTLEQLQQKYQGKNWLMLLWSLDCPPCFKELETVQQLHSGINKLPVVIVNVDSDSEIGAERISVIEQFQLTSLEHYYFVDGEVEKSRYQLDPNWHGELPRSYFFDASGQFRAKSGLVSKKLIKTWLAL